MRARNCLCTLAVSALAFTVAFAAPREAAQGKGQVRSDSARLLTGDQASLRTEVGGGVATGADPYMRLTPVAAPGNIPYPPGTVVDSAAGTISMPSGPATLFLEGRLGGWGAVGSPNTLKTYQDQVDSASFTSGGGGPLTNDSLACAADSDCTGAYGTMNEANPCDPANAWGANICPSAWQNNTRADWCLPPNVGQIPACDNVSVDRRCGSTSLGACTTDAGNECYMSHFALDVPANAAGTYTIDLLGGGASFIEDCSSTSFNPAKLAPALLTIPTGRCCTGVGTPAAACTPDVTQSQCPAPGLFQVGTDCPADGGPPCAECATAAQCVDERGSCATYQCVSNTCIRTNIAGYVPGGPNCCDPANGNQAPRADADPCTTDTCSVNDADSLGTPDHDPAPDGTGCDDDNPCSFADQCTGGACAGTNVNGTACATDADCQHGGETPGATCQADLTCDCALAPDLTLDVDNTGNPESCFDEGEKITVAVTVGPAANVINGGQFFIVYDPSCLDFVSISPVAPYTNEIYENVDESIGKIGYAVGIQLGGVGLPGNTNMAIISFTKIGECNTCNLCFTDNNPEHTYLTDDDGQPVLVVPSCSKDINDRPDIDLDVPDSVKVKVGCNSAVANVSWDPPSASSNCGPVDLICTGEHLESGTQWGPDRINDGGSFPIGNSNFCCTTSEPTCGGGLEGCWTVTVNDETALDVEIQLSPTMVTKPGGGITRCIEFEVFANCVQAPLEFCEDVTFGGLFDLVGHFNGLVKIPSAVQPACITVRDKLHTLRSCYTFAGDGGDCVDGVLSAVFKQDPFFGGNWLIGGNLDGWKKENPNASHDVIDILDFGQIAAQWMQTYDSNGDSIPDGNTPCPADCHPDDPHADINGDGLVDLLDYSFISMNFLEDSKDCCCPGSSSLGNTVGRTEISVRELFETGQGDLAVADLNADGMVNVSDMAALMQGVRPTTKPADRGGKDSGSRGSNKR